MLEKLLQELIGSSGLQLYNCYSPAKGLTLQTLKRHTSHPGIQDVKIWPLCQGFSSRSPVVFLTILTRRWLKGPFGILAVAWTFGCLEAHWIFSLLVQVFSSTLIGFSTRRRFLSAPRFSSPGSPW